MAEWGDLFTARQRLALATVSRMVREFESTEMYVNDFLGLAVSRWADISNALCRWESTKNQVRNLFTRQAILIVWDFAEAGVFSAQAGDFSVTLDSLLRTTERIAALSTVGQTGQADACESKLPSGAAQIWFTDPPYYDAIPYSDLSEFFFVWLERTLPINSLIRYHYESDNPLIPAALMIDPCPGAAGDRINALLVADEEMPSLLAGCDDGLIVVPDKPAELVTTQVVPNVLHWVEFW